MTFSQSLKNKPIKKTKDEKIEGHKFLLPKENTLSPTSKKASKYKVSLPKYYAMLRSPELVIAKHKKLVRAKQKSIKPKATTRTTVVKALASECNTHKGDQLMRRSGRKRVRRSFDFCLKDLKRNRNKTPKQKKRYTSSINTSHAQRSTMNNSIIKKQRNCSKKLMFSPYD